MVNKKDFVKKKKTSETGFLREYLLLKLGDYFLAFQTNYVREVFDIKIEKDIVPIPFTPSYIRGIVKIRGDILPVISLPELLGMEESEENCLKVAVLEEKMKLAFLFNVVVDLISIDDKDIEVLKDATKKEENKYLSGQFNYEGSKISIVDVYKLYSSELLH